MRRPKFLNTILGVVIAAGCAQAPGTGPTQTQTREIPPLSSFTAPPQQLLGLDVTGTLSDLLVRCKPLPAERRSVELDASGGTLAIGPHQLVVPPGALDRRTRITAEIESDNVNSVRFKPEGLQFKVPTFLFLSYQNCNAGSGMLRVVYTSDDLSSLLETLPSVDVKLKKEVVGVVKHFSRYAVAY